MINIHSLHRVLIGGVIWAAFSACAPSTYNLKAPTASTGKYELVSTAAKQKLVVLDERRVDDRTFSSGVLPAALTIDKAPIDPPKFLAEYLAGEFAARGVPISTTTFNDGVPRLHVKAFRMKNHRVNAFSPFVTLTYVSADLEMASGTKRIGVFVKRGKVPVWSFDEIVEPTLNQPLSIAVREMASKIANAYGYRASDAAVKELTTKIATRNEDTFIDVYSLGFTNNPTAVAALVPLLDDPDEYIRLAAISSMGTLGAIAQIPRLKSIYQSQALWQDRAMAVKALADMGTPETKAFVADELKKMGGQSDKDAMWITDILALYQ